ncbi:hypothetical protein [Romboutsia timonensis]|uniref:hypothetical protein n=1 Tax=Romboutsia timonensis TaxID=1776391 RepID=UPI0023F6C571|nr:hypothetical protein [Romboutsia timonensis]
MSLKRKLFDMYNEKSYTTEMERVACEMYYAICNVVEILVEESKFHIDSKEAIEQIREEMNVINKI